MPKPPAQTTRRTLIQSSLAATAAVAATNFTASSTHADHHAEKKVTANATILFQGDSITDAGRNRRTKSYNNSGALGRGYPNLVAGALLADHPTANLKIYNKGISGNKVPDLDKRWKQDAVDIKPNILSILIGVNDIWHKLNGRYKGTVETYETGFRALLKRTQKEIPGVRIVICEPFVLRCGAVNAKWFPEFDHRRAVAKKLANEFKLDFAPFQTMFDQAVKSTKPQYWAGDGVHPSLAGHALMAKHWRKVVGI